MNMKDIVEICKGQNPSTLLKSVQHCHTKNVSSIVISENEGRLTRIFLAWPHHKLNLNNDLNTMSVGVHDHKYDVKITTLLGTVRNVIYKVKSNSPVYSASHLVKHYTVESNGFPPKIVEHESKRLEARGILYQNPTNQPIELKHNELHTIVVNGMAAWLVEEGETVKTTTNLYTNNTIDLDGLYVPFRNEEEVIKHIYDFCVEYCGIP